MSDNLLIKMVEDVCSLKTFTWFLMLSKGSETVDSRPFVSFSGVNVWVTEVVQTFSQKYVISAQCYWRFVHPYIHINTVGSQVLPILIPLVVQLSNYLTGK